MIKHNPVTGKYIKESFTQIEKNYKKLTENYSKENAIKYLDYISSKPIGDVLDNLECVMSVPTHQTWTLMENMLSILIDKKDRDSIEYVQNKVLEFKNVCKETGNDRFDMDISVFLGKSNSYLESSKITCEQSTKRILKSSGIDESNENYKIFYNYTYYTNKILNECCSMSDDELVSNLTKLSDADLRLQNLKAINGDSKTTFNHPIPEGKISAGYKELLKNVDFFKIIESVKESSYEEEFKNWSIDIITSSIKPIFDNDTSTNKADFSNLLNTIEVMISKCECPNLKQLLTDALEELDSFLLDVYGMEELINTDNSLKEMESYKVLPLEAYKNRLEPNRVMEPLIDNEHLPQHIKESVDNYIESYNLFKESNEFSSVDAYNMIVNMHIISKELNMESGRNSVAGKIGRKAEELTRGAVEKVKKTGKDISQATQGFKKASENIDKFLSKSLQDILDQPYKEKREEILTGGVYVKLNNALKTMIRVGAVYALAGPGWAIIALLSKLARDGHVDHVERQKILRELKAELKMVEEKIDDAKSDGNKQAKYTLMRTKDKLENEINRIEHHIDNDGHRSDVHDRTNKD